MRLSKRRGLEACVKVGPTFKARNCALTAGAKPEQKRQMLHMLRQDIEVALRPRIPPSCRAAHKHCENTMGRSQVLDSDVQASQLHDLPARQAEGR